jgi:outer membrane lipopolysaccharide assembly protein LptE/RlpB
MLKKFAVFLILILFTGSCGFTPIYSNKKNNNISLEKINFKGDREINNYLKSNLNRYKNKSSSKKIFLDIETVYSKNLLSKDSSGAINKYELVAQVIFTVNPGDKKIEFIQKKIMENMNNKFDEKNYETTTKQIFANIITEKLIEKLIEF